MKSFYVVILTLIVAIVAFVNAQPIYPVTNAGIGVIGLGNHDISSTNSFPNYAEDFSYRFDVVTDDD